MKRGEIDLGYLYLRLLVRLRLATVRQPQTAGA
jgi:hypothetical protein